MPPRAKVILHPSDFSPASRAAFRTAVELARTTASRLVILHVMSPVAGIAGDVYVPPQAYDQMYQAMRAVAEKKLERLVAEARKQGVKATGLLRSGVYHERIAQAARAARATTIVMGTHGWTGVRRVVLGSVADRVMATAPCPVLTVRAR